MMIKYSLTILLFVSALSTTSAVFAETPPKSPNPSAKQMQSLDKILAVVNDDVITQSDVDRRINIVKMQLNRAHTPIPSDKALKKQVLQQLINEQVQLQAADKLNITIDNETLNKAIDNIAKQNKMTVAQFKTHLKNDNINYQDFRSEVRDEIIISHAQDREVKPHVIVTDQEVDNFLSAFNALQDKHLEYRVEDILIALPDSPTPEQVEQTRKKADNIVKQLHLGANFETLANMQSNGDQALNGGDLGWRSLARLPTVFAEKVENMKKGDIAGPIHTANGFHIIKLVDVKGEAQTHYVKEAKARHILIKMNAVMTDQKAKAELQKLRKELLNGASFAKLAKQYSDDPGSASQGGELGWVTDQELVPAFAKAMDKLPLHKVSQPVKSQFGWHLIEVEARRTQNNTAEYKRERIRNMISQRKYEEAIAVWVKQLRAQAYIKEFH